MTALRSDEQWLFASAMRIEHAAAKRLGASLLVGVACRLQKPVRPVISFGFAGALTSGLNIGDIIDATKVVDKNGTVLWQGNPLGVVNAYTGTIVTPAERLLSLGIIQFGSRALRALHSVTF